MHSGYPIMLLSGVLNVTDIRLNGGWGVFHELGHNMQYKPWVWEATVETTPNVWSVFLHETVRLSPPSSSHASPLTPTRPSDGR